MKDPGREGRMSWHLWVEVSKKLPYPSPTLFKGHDVTGTQAQAADFIYKVMDQRSFQAAPSWKKEHVFRFSVSPSHILGLLSLTHSLTSFPVRTQSNISLCFGILWVPHFHWIQKVLRILHHPTPISALLPLKNKIQSLRVRIIDVPDCRFLQTEKLGVQGRQGLAWCHTARSCQSEAWLLTRNIDALENFAIWGLNFPWKYQEKWPQLITSQLWLRHISKVLL